MVLSLGGMRDPLTLAADAELEALSSVARTLEPTPDNERKWVLRDEAAFLLDNLLFRVARGRGALDLAIGDGLATLMVGDRLLRLGFSCLGDYARERLGLAGSTAEKLARLSRSLSDRPLLRDAVCSGAVSPRKAETIVALARGSDEAAWVEKARDETVRALAAEVRTRLGDAAAEAEEEEPWERFGLVLEPAARQQLGVALDLAGRLLGAMAPPWQRLEVICQEYLGSHQAPPEPARSFSIEGLNRPVNPEAELDALKAWLEQEYQHWSFLTRFDPAPLAEPAGSAGSAGEGEGAAGVLAGVSAVAGQAAGADPAEASEHAAGEAAGGAAVDLLRLDADLRRLRDLRSRWDDLLGHLAMLLLQLGLWRDMQFLGFGHYCAERLGLSERAIRQRVALERRLWDLPALRDAMRSGRVSYEKARIVAANATEQTLESWLQRAERTTCIALAREVDSKEEEQMCAAGELRLRLPGRASRLLDEALRAARAAAGRWIQLGEALRLVAEHFIDTYQEQLSERSTLQKRVIARDLGRCQVPGCSRAAIHAHHVRFRSHQGADAPENLTGLCAAHHLHGIHAGYLRVTGVAPHRLRWRFRPGGGPLLGAVAQAAAS